MKFFSPYYGHKSLKKIKKQLFKELRRELCPIDPDVFDIVIAINQLPFVVHTIESCSGHINCKTGLPKVMEAEIKYYWYSLSCAFTDPPDYDEESYRKYMHPKYQLAAYFFHSKFYKRIFKKSKGKKKKIYYQQEFIDALTPELKVAYLEICKNQDPDYTNYRELVEEPEQTEVFEAIANAVYNANPDLTIYEQLQSLAIRIFNLDGTKYCDWAWGLSSDTGTFLDILYVESSIARDFHRDLAKLFSGRNDNISLRQEEDAEILEEMTSGDPDATCIACFGIVSECNCREDEDIFPADWTPEKELKEIREKQKVQFQVAYWKTLKTPLTVARLDVFWKKVWKIIKKYQN